MSMKRMISVWTVVICLWVIPSQAAVLDPWAFTSLGTLNASEAISINTDTLELTGGASYAGVLDPVSGAGIFAFDGIIGTNLSIFGTRTLGLLSTGNIVFTGTIDLLGSGGSEMVAIDSLAIKDLVTTGAGGDIQLHANQVILSGSITLLNRSLSITSAIDIVGLGGTWVVPLADRTIPVISPGGTIVVTNRETAAPVPLPASLVFFFTGIASLGLITRRTMQPK